MTSNIYVYPEKQIADLVFEILEERQSKFLLLVCDDEEIRKAIRTRLDRDLAEADKKIVSISAAKTTENLLDRFYAESRLETPDVIALWGLHRLSAQISEVVLKQLNFHRDSLAALKVPIIIWLTNELLSHLPSLAPDFWSRRTGIYRFTPQPTRELLKRLFANGEDGGLSGKETEIGKAISEVRGSERALRKCLRTDSFKVEHADALMAKIHESVLILRKQCENGNPIDVALHLWSLAHLDAHLERILGNMSTGDRNVYEYLYTDRNEALLFTAQKLPQIIEKYLETIPENVRKKRRPNLVKDFFRIAIDKLTDIAGDIDAAIAISIDQLEHVLVDKSEEGDSDEEPTSTLESTVGAQASYDLESWLTGYNDKRPVLFSEAEGKLLKLLYSADLPIRELAKEVGLSVPKVRKEIGRLEEKVRLYLTSGRGLLSPSAAETLRSSTGR